MRKLILLLLLFSITVFAQQNPPVRLIVSGQGETISQAKQNALRGAIEQAFGAFISSNTEILNDELVKDEIISVSNGNIENYNVLSEMQLPSGGYAITLEATVSVSKLTSFVESKGVEVEFKGGLLAANIKQQILNEKNEIKTIENFIKISEEILDKSYDFELQRGEPKQNGNNDSWAIPLTVNVKFNKNINLFNSYLHNSLMGLSMSEGEINRYNQLGKETYKIIIGNKEDDGTAGKVYRSVFKATRLEKSAVRRGDSRAGYQNWLKVDKENLTYRISSSYYGTNFETNQIEEIVAFYKQLGPYSKTTPYVYYYRKNPKRVLHFRAKSTLHLITDLIYRNKKGLLNFEITNGISSIIGKDFYDIEYIRKHRLKLSYKKFNPILRNIDYSFKAVNLFENYHEDFSFTEHSGSFIETNTKEFKEYTRNGYFWLSHNILKTTYSRYEFDGHGGPSASIKAKKIAELEKQKNQYAFLHEFYENPVYSNIPMMVISLSDFNFTDSNVFSISMIDVLSLAEIAELKGYSISQKK